MRDPTDRASIKPRPIHEAGAHHGPAGGTAYALNDLVVLSGRASDLEDRLVEKLAWTSDRDGDLGIGPEVATRDLSAGEHVITLKATDSQGLTGEATVRESSTAAGWRTPRTLRPKRGCGPS